MNDGFINSYDLASFLLHLITGHTIRSPQSHPWIFWCGNPPGLYFSSGDGKEPKSREQQIRVKPRIRRLELVQWDSDAKHRSGVETGTNTLSSMALLPDPQPPPTHTVPSSEPWGHPVFWRPQSKLSQEMSGAKLIPTWQEGRKELEISQLRSLWEKRNFKLPKIHHSCHMLLLFHSYQKLWEFQLPNITLRN